MIKESPFDEDDAPRFGVTRGSSASFNNPFDRRSSTTERETVASQPGEAYVWQDGFERAHRPMDLYLDELLSRMDGGEKVVIIQAQTGVGKTTRIPQAILDHDPSARIYMTQTRRPAVRMNARSIAKEMSGRRINEPISDDDLFTRKGARQVNWRLRGEDRHEFREERLTVMIDQSLTNRIKNEGKLPDGYLIIDEAHERTVQIDILLALIKEYLPHSPNTKVLITSATIDTQKFKKFFEKNAENPIIAKNDRLFPIEVKPIRLEKRGSIREHHSEGAIRAAKVEVLAKWVKGELTTPGKEPGDERIKVESGSVLVLLPGKDDINTVMRAIQAEARRLGIPDKKVEVMQCHGQMERHEQEQVERAVPPGVLRFVCATEILRSSVTVPNVVGVIDSLQIKRYSVDEHGVSHLGKNQVSGAEADQGKGRAGREQPGFYIPISFEQEYEQITNLRSSEYWPQPAIQREALTSVVLQIAQVGLSIRTLDMLDKPPVNKINVAIERLQKLGMLDEKEEITELGKILVNFPIEPERARVLITAETLGVLPETIIATAILENEGLRFVPGRESRTLLVVTEGILRKMLTDSKSRGTINSTIDESTTSDDLLAVLPPWASRRSDGRFDIDVNNYIFPFREGAKKIAEYVWAEFSEESGSDFYASVQAYRTFKAHQRYLMSAHNTQLGFDEYEEVSNNARKARIADLERQWCFDHFMNYKKMQFVDSMVRDLREEVYNSPLQLNGDLYSQRYFSADDLTKALLSGLVDNIVTRTGGDMYSGAIAEAVTKSSSSAVSINPDFLLVGGVRKVEFQEKKKETRYFADMVAVVQPSWFMEVVPQLCRQEMLEKNAYYNGETGKVEGQRETYYGKILVSEEKIQAIGELGTTMLAKALIEGKTGHQHESENKQHIQRITELLHRDRNQINFAQRILEWYKAKLNQASTFEEIEQMNLELTYEDVCEMLGTDFNEYEQRVVREKPDFIEFEGISYPLFYDKALVRLSLPLSIIQTLSWDQLPELKGFDVQVTASEEKYKSVSDNDGLRARRLTSQSLDTFRHIIEQKRLSMRWTEFIGTKGITHNTMPQNYKQEMIRVAYQDELPELPSLPPTEVWDEQSQSLAYPAHVNIPNYSGDGATHWIISWYMTQSQAENAEQNAREKQTKLHEEKYDKVHFTELVQYVQQYYQQVAELLSSIDLADRELYGLSLAEVGDVSTLRGDSLTARLNRARWSAGLDEYQAIPRQAYNELEALKTRLEEALHYFQTEGQRILDFRRQKESISAPEAEPGEPMMFVYRTASGKLIASAAAAVTSRISTRNVLRGEGVIELDSVLAEKLYWLIRPDTSINAMLSGRWFVVPESGVISNEREPMKSSDRKYQYRLGQVPQSVGLYRVHAAFSYDENEIVESTVYPASYSLGTRDKESEKVAVSLFDVTKWLEREEAAPGKRLYTANRKARPEYDRQQEVWYDAQQLYRQLQDRQQLWLTPEELQGRSAVVGSQSLSEQADPVDSLLEENMRSSSINKRVRDSFIAGPNIESLTPTQTEPKSYADLLFLARRVKALLPNQGFINLGKNMIQSMIDRLTPGLSREERQSIESELSEIARTANIDIEALSPSTTQFSASPPRTELPPVRIRADEYKDFLSSSISTLTSVISTERKSDAGRWRLAVAALATKGDEGIQIVSRLEINDKTKQDIIGTLQKAINGAKIAKRQDLADIPSELQKGILSVEVACSLALARMHPLLNQYFGEDKDARATFEPLFRQRIEEVIGESGEVPEQDALSELIEAVILENEHILFG